MPRRLMLGTNFYSSNTMDSLTSPLMRLPKGIRKRILSDALRSQHIRYHNREIQKPAEKKGLHATQHYDWMAHYRCLQPAFRIYDPRTGHEGFRWLSSLMSLSRVSRQLREETRLLVWEVNVFHVSPLSYCTMILRLC